MKFRVDKITQVLIHYHVRPTGVLSDKFVSIIDLYGYCAVMYLSPTTEAEENNGCGHWYFSNQVM